MSTPEKEKLQFVRGDDVTYNLQFKDSTGTPINITGWKVYFTIKLNIDDPDTAAVLKVDVTTHLDPVNGRTQIKLTNVQTDILEGAYRYDLQVKKTDGTINTIMLDGMKVLADVTRRKS